MIRRTDALTVAGVWLLTVGGSAYMIVPSGVAPTIQQDLAIGAAAVGWLISIPYAAEAIASMPAGTMLSRVNRRYILTGSVLGLVGACLWGWQAGVTGNYWSFLLSRFFGGAAFVMLWIASIEVVTREINEYTATAVGVYTTSGPAGLAVGLAVTPALSPLVGWPGVFGVFGVVLCTSLLVSWKTLPSEPDNNVVAPSEQPPIRTVLAAVSTDRTVLLIGVMSFSAYSLFLFFASWMPSYLSETFDLTLEQSGLFVALFPAVGIVARAGGGWLSDRLFEQRRRPIVRLSFFTALPTVVAVTAVSDLEAVLALIVVGGFFVQLSIGVFFTYGSELETPYPNGTLVAFLTMAGLMGSFSAPIITGALIDSTETYAAAFAYAIGLAAVGTAAALIIRKPTSMTNA
jgi:predicted MFS family arabinose efflux permease